MLFFCGGGGGGLFSEFYGISAVTAYQRCVAFSKFALSKSERIKLCSRGKRQCLNPIRPGGRGWGSGRKRPR